MILVAYWTRVTYLVFEFFKRRPLKHLFLVMQVFVGFLLNHSCRKIAADIYISRCWLARNTTYWILVYCLLWWAYFCLGTLGRDLLDLLCTSAVVYLKDVDTPKQYRYMCHTRIILVPGWAFDSINTRSWVFILDDRVSSYIVYGHRKDASVCCVCAEKKTDRHQREREKKNEQKRSSDRFGGSCVVAVTYCCWVISKAAQVWGGNNKRFLSLSRTWLLEGCLYLVAFR